MAARRPGGDLAAGVGDLVEQGRRLMTIAPQEG